MKKTYNVPATGSYQVNALSVLMGSGLQTRGQLGAYDLLGGSQGANPGGAL